MYLRVRKSFRILFVCTYVYIYHSVISENSPIVPGAAVFAVGFIHVFIYFCYLVLLFMRKCLSKRGRRRTRGRRELGTRKREVRRAKQNICYIRVLNTLILYTIRYIHCAAVFLMDVTVISVIDPGVYIKRATL